MAAAFTFFLIQLFGFHRYADRQEGKPFLNNWQSRYRSVGAGQEDRFFCGNTTYDYRLTPQQMNAIGPYNMIGVQCEWYNDAEVVHLDGSTLGIVTNIMEPYQSNFFNITPHFVLGVEQVRISVQHGVYHPYVGSVFSPATDVLDSSGNVLESFSASSFPSITMELISRATGLSLEDEKPQEAPELNLPTLKQRNAGIQITVTIDCTNRRDWDWHSEVRCTMSFRPLYNVWGILPNAIVQTASGQGQVSVSRIGVKFVIQQSATIYVPEANAVVNQFSSFISLVLLASFLSTHLFDFFHPHVRAVRHVDPEGGHVDHGPRDDTGGHGHRKTASGGENAATKDPLECDDGRRRISESSRKSAWEPEADGKPCNEGDMQAESFRKETSIA